MAKEQAAQGNGYCWHRDQLQYGLERHCVLFTDDRDNRTRRINWIRDFESRESAHQGELNNET